MIKIKQLIKKYYKYLLSSIVIISLIIGGIIVNAKDSTQVSNIKINYDNNNYITIYIEGEVNYPGKYIIKSNCSIMDVITEAKGLTKNAELAYINLNKTLVDQETIYIPKKNNETNKTRINVNIATLEQLTKLPGIGTEKASSIILYRTTNGPFNVLEDLLNVPGITNTILLNIKNEIKLS